MSPFHYKKERNDKYGKWATGRGTKSNFVTFDDNNKVGADGTYKGMELFIACDEYGKVIVFDKAGKILVTYVPKGQTTVITEAKTGSPVKAALPASFSMRRKNRGLESIAVSGEKTRAYTCMQSTTSVSRVTLTSKWLWSNPRPK